MKQKILLLGAYGQNNLGDELLLATFLNIFKRYDVIANSTSPLETKNQFGIETFTKNADLLKYLFKVKYVVVGGGSQFKTLPSVFKRNPNSLLLNIFLVTLATRLLFKKIYFISVGAGPLDTKISKLLTKLIIVFSNKVLVRDTQSFDLLHQISPNKKLISSADGLYFAKAVIEKQLKANLSQKKQSKEIIISPNLNTKDEKLRQIEIDLLAELTNKLIETGYSVKFIPFQVGFSTIDDLEAAKLIIQKTGRNFGYDPIIKLNTTEIYSLFDQAHLIIGVRLHSLIISTLCQTPVIAISYDPKVQGYMNDINQSEYCFNLEPLIDPKSIMKKIIKITSDYENVTAQIKLAADKIEKKLTHSISDLGIEF